MHRRPAHKQHGGLWEFPGGKVEQEETPGNALIRELAEELGIEIEPQDVMPIAFAEGVGEGEYPPTVILLYTVGKWLGDLAAREPGAQLGWFRPCEIEQLERPPLDVELSMKLLGIDRARPGDG